MRLLSCLHVQHKITVYWRCFSLEWMVLHPIWGDKDRFTQVALDTQQICKGKQCYSPPRRTYHFARNYPFRVLCLVEGSGTGSFHARPRKTFLTKLGAIWNPTTVALLGDSSCLIDEASQDKIEQQCTLWRSKETSSEVFEVGTCNLCIHVLTASHTLLWDS